jgi:hypothetical protein
MTVGILNNTAPATQVPILISHDCDITEDNLEAEPYVEFILAETVDGADPNRTHAKSPHLLHLPILLAGDSATLQFEANKKGRIRKDVLPGCPDDRITLPEESIKILRAWLASRYRRAALPDALTHHLSAIRETLQELGRKSPHAIIGFYVSYEPSGEIDTSEEPYELWIAVVFDHTVASAEAIASAAAEKITKRIEKKFMTPEGWSRIDLRSCKPASDRDFSLYDSQTMTLLRFEHISLKHAAREDFH